ncbi:MAG TPA: response regulator [Anaerovoracaceae bacterium]|nr:response regulator [Anaerovoracaceae bacterium]
MYKVMITDDEKVAIDSLKFIIEKNFSDAEIIATARSGREAVEKVKEHDPDILFMDIHMPGINGLEAIREIRKHHSRTAVIVLTAFDQFEYAKDAINLGVMEYLLKPVNRSKVVEVVARAMDRIREEKEKQQKELELREQLKSAEESLKALQDLRGSAAHFTDTPAPGPQAPEYQGYKAGALTRRAKDYIKANFSKTITLEDVAREIHVSPQYLSKLFKDETGENFIEYLTGIRIRNAKSMLEGDELSIKEICYNIGYSDPNYFSRIFKKIVGVTPTEYKDERQRQ